MFVNKEEEECQDLLKQLEGINIDELLMNAESRASNAPKNNNNQGSSSNSPTTSNPVTLTTTEQNSKTTQSLQAPSSYDFSQYSEQSYRSGRGRSNLLEVVKTMPRQSN